MAKASRTKRPPEKVRVRASVKQDKPSGWKFLLQVLVIGAACIWIYHPVLHGDWLWDDDKLVTNNSLVHDPNGWWKIWLEPGKLLDYQPLGISVVWLEWHAWGSDTLGYHWVNVFFHFLSALLVWRLLAKVGLRFAWLGGLLFAVHPIMVETVAWISEFKNTLSLPLFLLSLICWIDYEERRRRNDYFWALGLFLAAMLIKPSMVMFPVVILLIAWWKRGRIGWSDLKASAPFFAVSLVLGLVTIWFANRLGLADFNIPLAGPLQRTALAGLSFSFYFSKFFLPVGLLPIYCRWPMTSPTAWAFLPWPVLGGVICFFLEQASRLGPACLVGARIFSPHARPLRRFHQRLLHDLHLGHGSSRLYSRHRSDRAHGGGLGIARWGASPTSPHLRRRFRRSHPDDARGGEPRLCPSLPQSGNALDLHSEIQSGSLPGPQQPRHRAGQIRPHTGSDRGIPRGLAD